jgi:hypothetical protein
LVVKEPIPGAKTNIAPYNHLMLKTILNSTVEDQHKQMERAALKRAAL